MVADQVSGGSAGTRCQNQGFVEPAVAEAGVLQRSVLSLLLSGPRPPVDR